MSFPRPRRLLICTVIPLLVAQVGCAARGVGLPLAPPPVPVSEADQKTCEEYSARQKQKSVAGPALLGVVLTPIGVGLGLLGAVGGHPEGVGLPVAAFTWASDNAKENRATREAAFRSCLEPIVRARALGPEHPDVAESLRTLADGCVAVEAFGKAEPLYQRALAIQERALGAQHPEVSRTLESYATLLRRTNRDAEAALMEARATAIRATPGPDRQIESTPDPSRPEPDPAE